MKTHLFVAASFACVSCLSALSQAVAPTPAPASQPLRNPSTPASATVQASYGKLPLSFEANQGQSDPQVKFISRGRGYSLYLTDSAAVLALTKGNPATNKKLDPRPAVGKTSRPETSKTDVVRMELAGANPGLRVSGADQLPGTANYFIGNDPAKWHSNVPTYAKVKYTGVYPGVDLVYYGNQQQLEYDFVVTPGSDPKPVRLHFTGAKRLQLNANGDLTIIAKDGEIAFHKPVIYQTVDGQQQPVEGSFTLLANNGVGFKVGAYDHDRELVIDPVLAYSTYLGGSGSGSRIGDNPVGITVDGNGNLYVTGSTTSNDFPLTERAFQSTIAPSQFGSVEHAFITKLNSAGSALIFSTYLGGSFIDLGTRIKVDEMGNVYVAGSTYSTNFPVTAGAYQTVNKAASVDNDNAFLTKLNPTGSALLYSTYLGNTGGTSDSGLAVDSSGRAFVTGLTGDDFPVTSGAFQRSTSSITAFVTEFNATGSDLIYSTLFGEQADATAIAIDSSDHAYITGYTFGDGSSGNSFSVPTTAGAFQQTTSNKTGTGFVAKLNDTGSGLIYATYLGGGTGEVGDVDDLPYGIAVDSSGNAFIAGATYSKNFPVTSGAFQRVDNSTVYYDSTAFVTKLNSTGTGLIYSTYLGGDGNDAAHGITIDASGDAYVAGYAQDSAFPTTADAYQKYLGPSYGANRPVFLTEFNPAGSALIYSTLFGSLTMVAETSDIAVDRLNNVYLSGSVSTDGSVTTTDLPITPGAFQPTNKLSDESEFTGFLAKFAFNGATTTSLTSSSNPQTSGENITFDAHVSSVEGSEIPSGIVSFIVDGVITAHQTLDGSGDASFATSTLTAGPHTVVASYLGHNTVSSASSGALTQTIAGQVSAPTFNPPGGIFSNLSLVVLQTASPGATIYYTTGSAIPTTSSTKYTAPIAISGTTTINAIAVESPNTQSPVVTATYTILPTAIATTTSIQSSLNPSTEGQSVTFTATVTAASGPTPTGSVIFKHGSTIMGSAPLVAGIAQFTTSGLTSEAYEVLAVYTGSSTDANSHSPSLLQVVDPQ